MTNRSSIKFLSLTVLCCLIASNNWNAVAQEPAQLEPAQLLDDPVVDRVTDAPANKQPADLRPQLDQINAKLDRLDRESSQTWLQYVISHDWVDPATFYSVLALTGFGLYRLRRAKNERRYEYVTYVLNVPLRCSDGRKLPPHLSDTDVVASHGLVTGILREDKLESALDKKQLSQLDDAVRKATPNGFLPIDHDMFAMFRTEISEIFNQFFMNWERKANTYECAEFREMYFSVMYENYTERKHVRILIIPKDRLHDLPQSPNEDETTILRSKKMISRLPNLRFMRDEMQRVQSGEIESSAYVRTFEIMDQR